MHSAVVSVTAQKQKIQSPSKSALKCRRKFLYYFPGGFIDATYLDWERNYKRNAHLQWNQTLDRATHRKLMQSEEFTEIAARAVRIESRTNLLFSFEKMALRDAVRSPLGARVFATGLYEFLYGVRSEEKRFEHWCESIAALPRKQTRVLTWPLLTVFGFVAQPEN